MNNKKIIIISLIVLTVLGSLFTALASNMLFDDLFNVGAGMANSTLFVSLPAVSVASVFVMVVLLMLRTYKRPDCAKRISRLYYIITIVLGGIGVLGVILSAAVVYKNFFGKHPFPGYLMIFLILNLLIIASGVFGLRLAKKMPEDTGRIKVNFLHVLKTIGWVMFIGMVFNRFGMLLGAPSYIYLRNLHQTFPFYLYLLMPLFLGVVEVLHILQLVDRKKLIIMAIVGLGLNVVFFAYIAIMGLNDTAFVSSLSQAMPLERMASKPVELPIHFLSYAGVAAAILVQNRKVKEVKE